MNALFVDGVGRTHEKVLNDRVDKFRIPVLRDSHTAAFDDAPEPAQPDVAEFDRLGALPDGRVVYAQTGVGWRLWGAQVVFTNALSQAVSAERLAQELDVALQRQLEQLKAKPMKVLYDVVVDEPEWDGKTRHVWGVGVPA